MNPRLTKPAEDILRSPVGIAWQARLTAGYFDAEVRRQILEEVHTTLASQAAVHGSELAELQDFVFAQLLAMASRDVPVPADSPAVESPDGVEERIIVSYPYPIARPYSALTEKERAMEAFGCLLDTFESLIHFLATVAVSAYLRSGLAIADCNRHLLEKFLKGPWSTGDLYALLCDTIRLAGDCAGFLPYQELPAYLFTPKGKPTASNRVFGSFVTLRNRAWGHAAGRDEAFYTDILPANLARMNRELALVKWLADWELIRPVRIDESGQITHADLLMGNWRKRDRPYNLVVCLEDLERHGGPVRAEKSLLLVASDRQRYLPLFPLSLFHFQLSAQGVFFLQRLEWQSARDARRLRRAGYVAYESDLQDHEESPGDLAARLLEQQVNRLETGPWQQTPPGDPTTPSPVLPADPDCELTEVRHEQAFHLRVFAGREPLLEALHNWIDGKKEGGYLLLLGPPGQGKSALMASLAQREGQRNDCLLHMVKTHRNPLRFVPSLISQAAKRAGVQFGVEAYRGDLDDLRNALVRALETLVQHNGRAVLVLDALDELEPSTERVEFLPPSLPVGVRAVLTCRPDIPLVQALRSRLRDLQEWQLPALREEDLPLILQRHLGSEGARDLENLLDWRKLFHRLQGNPLFLHRALNRVRTILAQARAEKVRPQIDMDSLPATLDALFQDIYSEIAEREGTRSRSPEGRQKAQMLQLLCLAQEPLDFGALSELLAAAGTPVSLEACRDRVLEMSQFLLDAGDNRFKPWHQGLTDYVCSQVLGVEGRRQAEAIYCSWLRQPAARSTLYRLRHHVHHLVQAERWEELGDVLTDLSFLETKVLAGLAFELACDFADATGRLPANCPRRRTLQLLGEALRADIHFIVRHPTTLFQCLWNSCWWYDCPEAARHYDPPPSGWPPEGPPWQERAPKLATLLETWRSAKEQATPGFVWLRSLRPPPIHLGTAQLAVFRGHEGTVTSVAFSPDGLLIASGAYDHAVHIWEARNGNVLVRLTGHSDVVTGVAFSPDGRQLVSSSSDRTLRLWDVADRCLLATFEGHKEEVVCVAFSATGEKIVSGAWDQTVRVWRTKDGAQLACFSVPDSVVRSVGFSPDGRRIVTASGMDVRIWDAESGQELACLRGPQDTRHSHNNTVYCVAFAPDGERILSGSADRTVCIWDVASGKQRTSSQDGSAIGLSRSFTQEDAVLGSAWSSDGRYIVVGLRDGTVRLWNVEQGRLIASLLGHSEPVEAVAFAPDGQRVISGSRDGTVRMWITDGGRELAPLRGHSSSVAQVHFAAQGERILTIATDATIRLWDGHTGEQLSCLRGENEKLAAKDRNWRSDVASLTRWYCSPDEWNLAFEPSYGSSHRDHFLVWSLRNGHVSYLPGDRIWAFERAGRYMIATADTDHCIRVWDGQAGTQQVCFQAEPGTFEKVCISKNGQWLVSVAVNEQGEVRQVWDLRAGVEHTRLRGSGQLRKLLFSPDCRRILGITVDETIYLWEIERSGEPLILISGLRSSVFRAAFSPDGRYVLCEVQSYFGLLEDNAIWVWDASTGRGLISLPAAWHCTWSVDFSPDGLRFLAVASNDPSIRVWELPSGKLLAQFRKYPTRIYSVAFSPNGQYIVSSEIDQTIRVWDTETGRELANLHEPHLDVTTVNFASDGQGIVFQEFLVSDPYQRHWREWDFQTGSFHEPMDRSATASSWQSVDAGDEIRIEKSIHQKAGAKDSAHGSVAALWQAQWRREQAEARGLAQREQIPSQPAFAWFPAKLWHLAHHRDTRTWAGAFGNYLCVFTLEGGPPTAPRRTAHFFPSPSEQESG